MDLAAEFFFKDLNVASKKLEIVCWRKKKYGGI